MLGENSNLDELKEVVQSGRYKIENDQAISATIKELFEEKTRPWHVFRELVSTEATYLKNISRIDNEAKEKILKAYDREMPKLSPSEKRECITRSELESLIDIYQELSNGQWEFLEALRHPDLDQWGQKLESLSELYAKFSILQSLKIPAAVDNALDGDEKFKDLSIVQSFLIMPVQRLPRYKLLAEELVKHTDQNDEHYRSFVQFKTMADTFVEQQEQSLLTDHSLMLLSEFSSYVQEARKPSETEKDTSEFKFSIYEQLEQQFSEKRKVNLRNAIKEVFSQCPPNKRPEFWSAIKQIPQPLLEMFNTNHNQIFKDMKYEPQQKPRKSKPLVFSEQDVESGEKETKKDKTKESELKQSKDGEKVLLSRSILANN